MHAIDLDLITTLRAYDTPTLTNAIDMVSSRPCTTGHTRPPLRSVTPTLPPMVGAVVTATIRSNDEWPARAVRDAAVQALFGAIDAVAVPVVVVVGDLDGGTGCLWGEVNATIARRVGAEGVVTDGLVRDVPELHAVGFRAVARAVGVSHAYVRVESVGEPVEVGGVAFGPGDLVHADQHGALLIPAEARAGLVAAAEDVIRREQALIGWARSAEFTLDDLRRRRVDH